MPSIFDLFNPGTTKQSTPQQKTSPVDMQSVFPNQPGANEAFMQFAQGLAGKNPQAIVEGLVSSGQMSDAQFKQFSQIASMLTGRRA